MTPFDFVKLMHNKKVKWEDLNEEEQKGWNTFIINRALSFTPDYLDTINKIHLYTGGQLSPNQIFKYYQSMLPSFFKFQKWIKKQDQNQFNPNLIEIVSAYLECSKQQAEDYLNILDKQEIKNLFKMMGLQDDEIKKLTKKL